MGKYHLVFILISVVFISGCTSYTGEVVDRPNLTEEVVDNKTINYTVQTTQPIKPEEAGSCFNITCSPSKKTCQDGFVAECANSCSDGACTNCIPDCTGHNPVKTDLCSGVTCTPGKLTCPDDFIAECVNTCSNGICSSCQPDCAGHEIKECTELWGCSDWSVCVSGTQTRTCTDSNNCGTTQNKPAETQSCSVSKLAPQIINISYNPPGTDDLSKLNEEYVVIFGVDVDMTGWTLSDAQNHVYTFPNYMIETIAIVHTGSGTNNATDLFWGRGTWVWNNKNDTATLKDSSGNIISIYSYP